MRLLANLRPQGAPDQSWQPTFETGAVPGRAIDSHAEAGVVLFGRQAEQIQLHRVLDLAADGASGIAIEGAPGVGKTALWRSVVEDARARGYKVITAAPGEPDASLAFAGLC